MQISGAAFTWMLEKIAAMMNLKSRSLQPTSVASVVGPSVNGLLN